MDFSTEQFQSSTPRTEINETLQHDILSNYCYTRSHAMSAQNVEEDCDAKA